ncbi:MAG: hypothetical protein AB8F94_10275 [Saprospiraceae bacterium]
MNTHTFNESKKRFEPIFKKCSFCKTGSNKSKMEDNCFFSVYNVQDRTNLVVFRNVKYSEIKIGIPRCKSCRKVHTLAKVATYLTLFIGIPLVFIIPIYFSAKHDLGTIGLIFLLVMTFGLVYLARVGIQKAIFNAYDIKNEKDGAVTESLVQDFLRSGWSTDRPRA